eukprot:gene289-3659_t
MQDGDEEEIAQVLQKCKKQLLKQVIDNVSQQHHSIRPKKAKVAQKEVASSELDVVKNEIDALQNLYEVVSTEAFQLDTPTISEDFPSQCDEDARLYQTLSKVVGLEEIEPTQVVAKNLAQMVHKLSTAINEQLNASLDNKS